MSDLDPVASLDAAAEEAGVTREELLKRAIVALAESEGVDVPDAAEVAAIESRLDDLDEELDAKVADLRERFIELYREVESLDGADADATDASAESAGTDETGARLDDLADELEAVSDRLDRLDATAADAASADRVDDLGDRIDALDARLDELDAVGDRLDGVDERVDAVDGRVDEMDRRVADVESDLDEISTDGLSEVDDKLSRVANAVVRVKRRLEAAERDRGDRERVDALTRTANRHGVRTADCDHCGGGVELGLLSTPECPHCGYRFEDLEPNTGFLGTSRLLVDGRPAIDGDVTEGDGPERRDATDTTGAAASDGGGGDRR